MLLIWDIHINRKYKDKILHTLQDFISQHPEEKNLIFLGDFVYHFSYDRSSLLALYDLFLDLYLQGKSLYILAGNHDRLGSSFVFEEARKAFMVLSPLLKGGKERSDGGFEHHEQQWTSQRTSPLDPIPSDTPPVRQDETKSKGGKQDGSIHFITKPLLTTIEGKPICFLPYMLDLDLADYPWIEQLQDDFYHEQIKTGNKNQILSAKLHLLVQYFISPLLKGGKERSDGGFECPPYEGGTKGGSKQNACNRTSPLDPIPSDTPPVRQDETKSEGGKQGGQWNVTFIHHYYFDGVVFPGQQSKFSFRDAALSAQWLEEQGLQFISWHLHQPFYHKNYLCTGSLRADTPLDENQLKGLRIRNEQGMAFHEVGINYYFNIDRSSSASQPLLEGDKSPVSEKDLHHHRQLLEKKLKADCQQIENFYQISYHFLPSLDLKAVSLSLGVEELNYQQMDDFVAPSLQTQLQDVKLKKPKRNVDDLLEKLQKPDAESLKEGFGGWIDLLKRFLMRQYPDTYQEYEKVLQDLKLV